MKKSSAWDAPIERGHHWTPFSSTIFKCTPNSHYTSELGFFHSCGWAFPSVTCITVFFHSFSSHLMTSWKWSTCCKHKHCEVCNVTVVQGLLGLDNVLLLHGLQWLFSSWTMASAHGVWTTGISKTNWRFASWILGVNFGDFLPWCWKCLCQWILAAKTNLLLLRKHQQWSRLSCTSMWRHKPAGVWGESFHSLTEIC